MSRCMVARDRVIRSREEANVGPLRAALGLAPAPNPLHRLLAFLIEWGLLAIALWVAATVLSGVDYDGWQSIVLVALILGLLNALRDRERFLGCRAGGADRHRRALGSRDTGEHAATRAVAGPVVQACAEQCCPSVGPGAFTRGSAPPSTCTWSVASTMSGATTAGCLPQAHVRGFA